MNDWDLLKEWTEHGSHEAFRSLVERHLRLVYSVARRSVGSPSHAEEVTQAVFVMLAQKGPSLPGRTVLAGWLYRATRFVALELVRKEARQQAKHDELARMETSEPLWEQVRPVLEDALDGISRNERDAIMLRFFEDRSLREVGAELNISEEAARKRVDRGLEQLRKLLARQGIATSSGLLSATLATHAVQSPPPGFADFLISNVATKSSMSTAALVTNTLKLMAWTKTKTVIETALAALLILGVGTVGVRYALRTSTASTSVAERLVGKWQINDGEETMEFRDDGTCVGLDRYGRVVVGTFSLRDGNHMKLELTTTATNRAGMRTVDKAAGVVEFALNEDSLTMNDDGSTKQYRRSN